MAKPPVLFISDVDGVVRARDRARGTSGMAHDHADDLHYAMDVESRLFDEDWTFHHSTEMIEVLRDLIRTGKIEFLWVTNWIHLAGEKLNPLFGFPTTVTHLPVEVDRGDHTQSYKAVALRAYLNSIPESERRPFIWVDDVAALPYSGEGAESLADFSIDHHILAPEERFGITRTEMSDILAFIAAHQ